MGPSADGVCGRGSNDGLSAVGWWLQPCSRRGKIRGRLSQCLHPMCEPGSASACWELGFGEGKFKMCMCKAVLRGLLSLQIEMGGLKRGKEIAGSPEMTAPAPRAATLHPQSSTSSRCPGASPSQATRGPWAVNAQGAAQDPSGLSLSPSSGDVGISPLSLC